MSEYPVCPFCEHRLTQPFLHHIEGPIRLRCPSCTRIYQHIPGVGSYPLDDDYGVEVTDGIFGPHVMSVYSHSESLIPPYGPDDISLSRALLIGGLCCCTIIVIIPIVFALLLALIG